MGTRQSKFDENYMLGTPHASEGVSLQSLYGTATSTQTSSDPRSPNALRTPICLPSNRVCTAGQLVPVENNEQKNASDKPFEMLKRRLLKGFAINDPRSPSLNRTPLVFDDTLDITLDLDDTFADLFIESEPFVKPASLMEDTEMPELTEPAKAIEEEEMPVVSVPTEATEVKAESQIVQQQDIDPRSPSIGVERTPIILCEDDNEDNDDAFLENILSTLTLNLSNSTDSSFVSLKSCNSYDAMETEKNIVALKPINKHLDRVRVAKKTISRSYHRRQNRNPHHKVYEDCMNQLKSDKNESINSVKEPRTPLSCLKNRHHVRSRSVESSTKSPKTNLLFKSFDDTLDPVLRGGSQDNC